MQFNLECERWQGAASVPRIKELEQMGMKRKAIAKLFNVTTATLRNAEREAQKNEEDSNE